MTTPLHGRIATVAGRDPAIYISNEILVSLLTRRLTEALGQYVGVYQAYPNAAGQVQIGIASTTYNPAQSGWRVDVQPAGASTGQFTFESDARFEVDFAVTQRGDATVSLFVVKLLVRRVTAFGFAGYNRLTIEDVSLDSATQVIPDPNLSINQALIGLNDLEVARLEGLVEGAIAPSVVKNIFDGIPSVDIKSLFPAVNFNGETELVALGPNLLVIARGGWSLDETQRCACSAEAPAIVIAPGQVVPPAQGAPPTAIGSLPITITVPPPSAALQPVDNQVDPSLCLYLPRPTLDAITGGPYPAVAGFVEDNGFIGFSFDYTVAFTKLSVSLTDPRATLVVALEHYITGHGDITVDVPCVGRQTVGRAWMNNRDTANPSLLEIGVTPRLNPDGKIVLHGELLSFNVRPFRVDVVTVAATLLSYFGPWGTVAGFVFDRVLGVIISQKLPRELRQAVKEAIGNQNWTLVDITRFDIATIIAGTRQQSAGVSREPNSALIGFNAGYGRS